MALRGTIKDFGIADILQLIGIQRKTGVLTLESGEDTVTVQFLDGSVVGADTRLRNLEDLLGGVLVRTGRITEEQLKQALERQKKTLQRLGYILVHGKAISEPELKEALHIQVGQIIYRLFRWREGTYHFRATETIDYDSDHFDPISADNILMEGARMIDEWPIIERRIRSEETVFRKTAAGAAVDIPVGSLVEDGVDLDFGFDGGEKSDAAEAQKIQLSADEREILRMVDGKASVREIVDRSSLGEFDSYRALYELLTRNLIAEAKRIRSAGPRSEGGVRKLAGRLVLALLLACSGLTLTTLGSNPLAPWKLEVGGGATDRLRNYASRVRLERIEEALRVFYLDTGAIPDELALLLANGYLEPRDLLDPWERRYRFERAAGSFRIWGLDGGGDPAPGLTITRKLSAVQRMLVDGAAQGP